MKFLWSKLLKITSFRKAILTHLRHDYFHEFHHSIPLGNKYWAHLLENDAYDSFSEIFIQEEYAAFIPDVPISKVLDLGANYGYFSLWLQSRRPHEEISSIMVEPSRRCIRTLENLVKLPQLKNRFNYLQCAIGDPTEEQITFFERPFMGGSLFASSSADSSYNVQTLAVSELPSHSFDLVKCDLEGSEWEFITNYVSILEKSKFLIMEWHSWHQGGGGFSQIETSLSKVGFEIVNTKNPENAIGREGQVGTLLARNFNCHD